MPKPNEDFRHRHQNVRVENAVQFGDLPEFIGFAYTGDVTRVNAAALASLATIATASPQFGDTQFALLKQLATRQALNRPPFLRWRYGRRLLSAIRKNADALSA